MHVMSREADFNVRRQYLVRSLPNGKVHVADVSDIVEGMFDQHSIHDSLMAFFKKNNLTIVPDKEAIQLGFLKQTPRLDRKASLPIPRSRLQRQIR